MWSYLPEIKKVFLTINKETDKLEELNQKVNEMIIDEIMRDFTIHKPLKEETQTGFKYQVKEDDFKHITDYLCEIQKTLLPEFVVIAQTDGKESYQIFFRRS